MQFVSTWYVSDVWGVFHKPKHFQSSLCCKDVIDLGAQKMLQDCACFWKRGSPIIHLVIFSVPGKELPIFQNIPLGIISISFPTQGRNFLALQDIRLSFEENKLFFFIFQYTYFYFSFCTFKCKTDRGDRNCKKKKSELQFSWVFSNMYRMRVIHILLKNPQNYFSFLR